MKYACAKPLTFLVSAASLALFTIRIFAPFHLNFSPANCLYQNIEDSKIKETQTIRLYPFDKSLSVFLLLCCFASFIVSLSSGWRWPISDNYIELIQLSDSITQLKTWQTISLSFGEGVVVVDLHTNLNFSLYFGIRSVLTQISITTASTFRNRKKKGGFLAFWISESILLIQYNCHSAFNNCYSFWCTWVKTIKSSSQGFHTAIDQCFSTFVFIIPV